MKHEDKLRQTLGKLFGEPSETSQAPPEAPVPEPVALAVNTPTLALVSAAKPNVAKAKAEKVAKKKPKRSKLREEELDVICREAPEGSEDLADVVGWLVLSYDAQGRPVGMLFDPAPNGLSNAEAALRGILRGDEKIALAETAEEGGGRWVFEIIEDASTALDDEDEDELAVDYDAADYDIEEGHPFNDGGV